MHLLKSNPAGGAPLKTQPFREDKETGCLVRLIGYCPHCKNPVNIRSIDYREMIENFLGITLEELTPKKPIRQRIGEWLIKA